MTGLGLLASVLVAARIPGRPAGLVILVAVLLLPGWLVVRRLGVTETAARYLLALTISMALEAAACLGMVFAGWWHPLALGAAVLGVSVVVLIFEMVAAGGRSPRRVGRSQAADPAVARDGDVR